MKRYKRTGRQLLCALLAAGVCGTGMMYCVSAAEDGAAETTTAAQQEAPADTGTTAAAAPAETTGAAGETLGSMEFEDLPDGTLRLKSFRWFDEPVVTVPADVNGKAVTEIGQRAFQYCYADEVVLPETVTKIGDEAFAGNAYMKKMTIPAGCTSIGYRAFAECDLLAEVTIPESVTYIGYLAFDSTPFYLSGQEDFTVLGGGVLYAYNGTAADVTIPANVAVIGPYACSNHAEMKSVTIPDSVKTVWDGAFDNCPELKTVQAPATFDYVDAAAFVNTAFYNDFSGDFLMLGDYLLHYAGKETEVHVPDGVRVVNDSAFEGNTAFTTLLLPDSVERVGRAACYRCTSLQVVTLGDKVQAIGDMAFYGCETLRYLRVGHQLSAIGDYAFAGCRDLETVYLPDTLTSIGDKAFGYVWNLDTSQYDKMSTALTLYSNTEAAKTYAQAEGIKLEPLPETENTEPPPQVTTVTTEQGAGIISGKAWIPAAGLGGVLVLIGAVTFAVRKKKKG